MSLTRVLGIVLAGGAGTRLEMLTERRAKPAVPFAGVYRLVDFPLSSCQHSHISDVWVVTQFHPASLAEHLANGRAWDLDRTTGGMVTLPPPGGGTIACEVFAFASAVLLDTLEELADEAGEEGLQDLGDVLLPGARVAAGATVERAVLDDGVEIGRGAEVGGTGDVSLVGRRTRVADGAHLPPGSRAPQH